jgi:hypothetical protein
VCTVPPPHSAASALLGGRLAPLIWLPYRSVTRRVGRRSTIIHQLVASETIHPARRHGRADCAGRSLCRQGKGIGIVELAHTLYSRKVTAFVEPPRHKIIPPRRDHGSTGCRCSSIGRTLASRVSAAAEISLVISDPTSWSFASPARCLLHGSGDTNRSNKTQSLRHPAGCHRVNGSGLIVTVNLFHGTCDLRRINTCCRRAAEFRAVLALSVP